MQNIYLFGFGTFGHPNDYRQSPFKLDKEDIAKNIKIFDLSNAIKVFPKSTLYSIRKENIGGLLGISYSIYTFANEMSSLRDGTFIGSSILFTSEIADENITIGKLNDFHKILVKSNTTNDVLRVNHSKDFKISSDFLQDFEKISYNLKPIIGLDDFTYKNKHIVIGTRTDTNTLTSNFKNSLLLLNKFDTIFFTNSREIMDYCKNRNIYSITDENGFKQEIEKLKEERKQKTKFTISEFENEKQKLEVDRKRLIDEYRLQIEQNEISHKDNGKNIQESKENIDQINQKYNAFSKKIEESIDKLKSGQILDIVRQIHNENKSIFIDSVNQKTKPKYINKICDQQPRTGLKKYYEPSQKKSSEENSLGHRENPKNSLDFFKVATLVLLLLWIGTLAYFLFFNRPKKEMQTIYEPQEQLEQTERDPILKIEKELIPKPNSELNEKEYKIVAKKIDSGMVIAEIVKIVFTSNPTDIRSSYSNQQDEYGKELFRLNKNSFLEKKNKILFTGDTLKNIPAHKKE